MVRRRTSQAPPPFDYRDAQWPIVFCRFHRAPTFDDLESYLAFLEGCARRGTFGRVVEWSEPWAPRERTRIAHWYTEVDPFLQPRFGALAYVPLTKEARLSLQAIFWRKESKPGEIFDDVATATDWVRQQLRALGVP